MEAVSKNQVDEVQRILNLGDMINLQCRDEEGRTPLMIAIQEGFLGKSGFLSQPLPLLYSSNQNLSYYNQVNRLFSHSASVSSRLGCEHEKEKL